MTESEFFGAIESNLRLLAESRVPLPACHLPDAVRGVLKLKRVTPLTGRHAPLPVPPGVRVYDLVSVQPLFADRQRFRVFAAYVEEATEDSYRRVKFLVRKWYQESGWADAVDRPYAGAFVVGSDARWPQGMRPNADDVPFEQVVFHLLAAPHERAAFGIAAEPLGDEEDGALIFRALVPETFEARARRVVGQVERLLDQQCGTVTVQLVEERTGVAADDISHVFNDLQAKGRVVIRRKDPRLQLRPLSPAECLYVEKGKAPFWTRWASKRKGTWYTHKGFVD